MPRRCDKYRYSCNSPCLNMVFAFDHLFPQSQDTVDCVLALNGNLLIYQHELLMPRLLTMNYLAPMGTSFPMGTLWVDDCSTGAKCKAMDQ